MYNMAVLTAHKIKINKNSNLSARNCEDNVICTTFAIKEEDLKNALMNTLDNTSKNSNVKQLMVELGIALGLNRGWGLRTNVILFKIQKNKLYIPTRLTSGNVIGLPLVGNADPIWLPNFNIPFIGTGRTMTKGTIKKLKYTDFPEYVIPKGTPFVNARQIALFDYIKEHAYKNTRSPDPTLKSHKRSRR